MGTRDTVKDYQRRLAELDADHVRAQTPLVAARQRRAELLAAQDRLVTKAEEAVNDAVVAMAAEVGPELAASLLDLDVARVRQLLRRPRPST